MSATKIITFEKNRFRFQGIEPDAELAGRANLRLVEMMAYAPAGAVASGTIQKVGNGYSAVVEVSSPFRTFFATAFSLSLGGAVNRALSKMDDQLYSWRFGRGGGQSERQPGFRDLTRSPMAG